MGIGRLLILTGSMLSIGPFPASAERLAIGARWIAPTVTSLDGVGTEKAEAVAVITKADVVRWCQDLDGIETDAEAKECATGNTEIGKRYTAAANCEAGTVRDLDEQTYKLAGVWKASDRNVGLAEGRRKFTDETGEIVPGSNAYRGVGIDANYDVLCKKVLDDPVEPRPSAVRQAAVRGPDVLDPAKLDGRIIWDHNGSEVLIDTDRGVIVYDKPKSSIAKAVRPGQVLFRGSIPTDGPVSGTAFTFKKGCAAAPYTVSGRWNDGELILRGASPRRSKSGCGIDGYTTSGGNATLKFTFLVSP